MVNEAKATIDCETRSTCSPKNSGSWKYSLDPATEVLCFAYRLPYWVAGRTALWHPAYTHLGIAEDTEHAALLELFEWIAADGLIEAHNAFFERGIWRNIMVPRFGWVSVPDYSWRCSAAKAAAHAIPRSLGDAGAALGLSETKIYGGMDVDGGGKIVQKTYKPRKPQKAEREAWAKLHGNKPHPIVYHESVEIFEKLWAYCRQDVLAEEALSARLADLSHEETEIYLLDQTINERGFQLDPGAISTAQRLIARETTLLNAELSQLTGGRVAKATQRAQMIAWFQSEGLDIYDTQKETIDGLLDSPRAFTPAALRGLQLVRTLGRSSTAKYKKMADWAGPDGRVRGGLLYHGATTGRWSGKGIQPHNFPRGKVKDQEAHWATLSTIPSFFPDIMDALSQGLRGTIIAPEGKQLYVADYAGIEARVLLWLASDKDGLDIFRRGEDIYCEMASEIYGYPVIPNEENQPPERQLGKVAILGLGYQMGWAKFIDTAWDLGRVRIDDDMSQRVVNAYRSKFWRVKNLWEEQQATAIEAVQIPQETVTTKSVSWLYDDDEGFLFCILPSGRRLAYPEPEIRSKQTPWGEMRASLTFMGVDGYAHAWTRQHTYGGSLVENITQAVARDLLACAMQRCEESATYTPVLTVHDELIAEAAIGAGSVSEFEQLMTTLPKWAKGCPVTAEGWRGLRYRK